MRASTIYKTGCPFIDDYAAAVFSGEVKSCKRLKLWIRKQLETLNDPDVFIDTVKAQKAVGMIEDFFQMKLLPWELYILGLVHSFYRSDDTVVFDEFLIVMGRGNGKNGFISALAWYLTTAEHGVQGYNVDIIANSEDQAKTSFQDITDMLNQNEHRVNRSFEWTKEQIKNISTNSVVKFHTSNARTKDGKRSGCLIFDEIHAYVDTALIDVFVSGFGKRKYSRQFNITTRGDVVDGVLDHYLDMADDLFAGELEAPGLAVLIYEMDAEEEVDDFELHEKANPSIRYFPELRKTIKKQYDKMKAGLISEDEFYTKRFNWPKRDREKAIASEQELRIASRPLPDMTGWSCVCGIDFAMLSDMAAIGLLFRKGKEYFWHCHAWIYKGGSDWNRIRVREQFPDWEKRGLLTIVPVEDNQISPELLTDWLAAQMQLYNVQSVTIDLARYELMKESLRPLGFCPENKNLLLARPLWLVAAVPVIDSMFRTGSLAWGDSPLMVNATSNTKKVRMKSQNASGNFKYDKVEARSRKTDAFFAFAHAVAGSLQGETLDNDTESFIEMTFTEF